MKVLDYEGLKTFATKIKSLLAGKQDKLTAGSNISIDSNNKISATDTKYTHPASHPASMITESTTKRFVSDAEKTTWTGKQDKLTAGDNITITDNKISAEVPTINYPVKSVNSKTGAVTITKSDLGLGSVENIGIVILSEAEYEALSAAEKARKDKLYGVYDG